MAPNLRDTQKCQSWLARHLVAATNLTEPLTSLAQALASQRLVSPPLTALDCVRDALLAPAERLIERAADARGLPDTRTAEQLEALDEVLNQLRLAVLTAGPLESSELHRQMPGTHSLTDEVLPLAGALQLQSMRIIARLRSRTVVTDDLWEELGYLAEAMRQSTFLDEPLAGPASEQSKLTPRAWIILPMLLHVAGLEAREPDQAVLVYRLAEHWAERVGFRIDPPRSKRLHTYGPTLKLGSAYRVRLDTHRLRNALVRRQARWLQPEPGAGKLPMGLTRVQLADLLEGLFECWSADWVSPRWRAAPQSLVRMRFGLPGREAVGARYWGQGGAQTYDHGHHHHEVAVAVAPDAQALAAIARQTLRGADRGRWMQVDRQRVMIDRQGGGRLPALTGLVSFGLDAGQSSAGGEATLKGLRLGRVHSAQRIGTEAGHGDIHRFVLETYSGTPLPVQIQDHSPGLASGAYLLAGQALPGGRTNSLFAAPARLTPGERVLLKRPDDEISVEIGPLVARGPDFEQFVVESRGSSQL